MAREDTVVDPFETYSGLPDDFDGTIRNPYFGYDSDYMDGDKLALLAELHSDSLEEPEKLLFGTGKDWEPDKTPKGTKITRQGRQQFHENAGCGLLLAAMMEHGAADVLRERNKEDGLTPFDAAIYDGLSFHWARQKSTYEIGGEKKETNRLLPSKFLGVVAVNGKSAKSSTAKTTKAEKAEKPAKAETKAAKDHDGDDDVASIIEALPTKTRSKLTAKAAAADSVEEFVESVKDLDLAGIDDEAVLLTIAPAIFAEANAD